MPAPSTPLKPRAIAVLVALRAGQRTLMQLRNALAEHSVGTMRYLLCDMKAEDLVISVPGDLWQLTTVGLGWLQTNGLDATPGAKEAIFDVAEDDLAHR